MKKIQAAKLIDNAILPTRKHPDDAGMDFYAAEEIEIPAHNFGTVRTGITVSIPAGYVGLMMPKSRNDHLLGAGVVDAGYQGEIMVKIANIKETPMRITPGTAIAQMILLPIVTPAVEKADADTIHAVKSERGATGGILEGK